MAQHTESMKLMQLQVESLRGLVQVQIPEMGAARWPAVPERVKLAKLIEADDIEAYLTMFEQLMQVPGTNEDTWVVMPENLSKHLPP